MIKKCSYFCTALGSRVIWKSNIAKVGSFVASSPDELLIISLEEPPPLSRLEKANMSAQFHNQNTSSVPLFLFLTAL